MNNREFVYEVFVAEERECRPYQVATFGKLWRESDRAVVRKYCCQLNLGEDVHLYWCRPGVPLNKGDWCIARIPAGEDGLGEYAP